MTHAPDNLPQKSPPRVSVIIPCYKQAHFLQQSIESTLEQHGADMQVIVINDGSPDNTAQVAQQFKNRILYIEQPNRGLAAARNRGLEAATGDFVIFLDADDALLPDTVQNHLSALGGGGDKPTADLSMCGYVELSQTGTRGPDHIAPQIPPDVFHSLLAGNWMPPVCIMARRSCIQRAGPFRNYHGLEDWDLWLRIAADPAARFVSAPNARVLYRTYPTSMSGNTKVMFEWMLQALAGYDSFHGDCPQCKAGTAAGRQTAYAFYCRRMRDQWRARTQPRARTLMQAAAQMLTHPRLLRFACTTLFQKHPPRPLAGGPAHE